MDACTIMRPDSVKSLQKEDDRRFKSLFSLLDVLSADSYTLVHNYITEFRICLYIMFASQCID